jgi:PAS domain S-box-containing protein
MKDESQDQGSGPKGGPVPGGPRKNLRGRAEKSLKKRGSPENRALSPEEGQRVIHELQVHQIELEMQNEELERARREAEEAHEKYRALYDFAPVGYFSLEKGGKILELNLTGSLLIGRPRVHIVGRRIQSFLTQESIPVFNAFVMKVLGSVDKQTCEVGIQSNGDEVRFFRIEGIASHGGSGAAQIRAAMIDITARNLAEEALREREALLGAVVQGSPIPQMVIGKDHRVIYWNRALEELSGLPATEAVGTTGQWRPFYPDERPVLADLLIDGTIQEIPRYYGGKFSPSKILNGAYEATDFFPNLGKEGGWLYFTAAPIRNARGSIIGAVETLEDITERKKAENSLQLERQRLFDILEVMPVMVCLLTQDYHVAFANRAFREKFGESQGGHCYEYCFGNKEPCDFCQSYTVLKTGKPHHWEVKTLSGDIIDVHDFPFTDTDGSTMVLEVDVDITEQKKMDKEIAQKAEELAQVNVELHAEVVQRKKAEETAKKTLSLLNAALESTADAMLVTDRDGRITSFNQNYTTMWNIPDPVLHTLDTRAAIVYVSGMMKDPGGYLARMEEISNHPSRESYDMLELQDGRIIERYSKPQKIGNSIVGRVFSYRDVTDRRRAEERLITSLEEKEVLLREIHHRVKNNLQLTTSLLDMTRMRTPDPGTESILTDVMMKIQTMAQIHTRLYESKRFDRINMGGQIRDQFRALESIYGGRDRDIAVEIDSPEIYLSIDKAIPCALALNEIFSNAYKHAFRGRRSGTVKYSAKDEGGHILFTVSDNGIGLPRGFDLSRANTLGLRLVRTLVEQQLKGTFRIRRKKEGTEVMIRIPVKGTEGEHD